MSDFRGIYFYFSVIYEENIFIETYYSIKSVILTLTFLSERIDILNYSALVVNYVCLDPTPVIEVCFIHLVFVHCF